LILDVTNPDHVRAAVQQVDELDVLINNAGIFRYDDLSDRAALDKHLAVNIFGSYALTQAFLPMLIRSQ